MYPRHRGGRAPGLGVWLLLMQVMQVGVNNIPPVTLVTMGAQVAIFLRLLKLPFNSPYEVCVSALHVWYKEEWQRLFYAPFFHLSDWHLYFNMVSYMWKGRSLERKMGSGYFLYMIAVFSLLTNLLYIGLAMTAEQLLHDPSYISSCAAGFSGVIFALKVITTHMMPPGVQHLLGFIPIHSRLACWAELVLIQLLVPNASFIGHLAGILVGMLYVKGPLKLLMDMFIQPEPSYHYHVGSTGRRSGGRTAPPPQHARRQYDGYTGGRSEEEQMAEALRRSTQHTQPRPTPSAPPPEPHPSASSSTAPPGGSQQGLYPNLGSFSSPNSGSNALSPEELRRRRLHRFDSS